MSRDDDDDYGDDDGAGAGADADAVAGYGSRLSRKAGGGGGGGYEGKKGGYDSRLEQLLCENPELQIVITEAGKSSEGGGGFIVYTIRTAVGAVGVGAVAGGWAG